MSRVARIGVLGIAAAAAMSVLAAPAQAATGETWNGYQTGCWSGWELAEANYAGDSYDGGSGCPSLNDSVSSAANWSWYQDFNLWTDSYWRGSAFDIPTWYDANFTGGDAWFDNKASSHEW